MESTRNGVACREARDRDGYLPLGSRPGPEAAAGLSEGRMTVTNLTVDRLKTMSPLFEIKKYQFFEHPTYGDEAPLIVLTPDERVIVQSDTWDYATASDGVDQGWYGADWSRCFEQPSVTATGGSARDVSMKPSTSAPGLAL